MNQIQFFSKKNIEYTDPLHKNSARRKTNSISDIVIQQFLITRTISLKKNWIQHQVKTTTKKIWKKAYMESKTVMLINSVLMTTLIPLYIWRYKWYIYSVRWRCHVLETEKIVVFHRQPYYRYYYYHISRMLRYQKKRRDCVFFFNLELCFKFRFFSRDNCWFWLWREL